jgi:hypothetical protein
MQRPRRQFDDVMIGGCGAFALGSVAQVLAVFAPFAVAPVLRGPGELWPAMALAGAIALMAGAIFSWRAEVAGFCGSVAGLVPAGLFLWVRLRDATEWLPIDGYEPADIPASWVWALPLAYACSLSLVWYLILLLRLRMERERPK